MDNLTTMSIGLTTTTEAELEKDPKILHSITAFEIVVLFLAVFGNVMLVILMRSPAMKRFSFSVYFTFTAVFDTMAIFWNCLEDGYELTHTSLIEADASRAYTFGCGVLEELDGWGPTSSVWLVVAVCVDRYISICHMGLSQTYCRRKVALLVCCILVTCTFFYEFPWSLVNIDKDSLDGNVTKESIRCGTESDDNLIGLEFAEDYVQVLIPLIIVTVLNVRILVVLNRKKAFRDEMSLTQDGRQRNHDNKFNTSIFYLLVITVIAWLPWMIVNMIITIKYDYLEQDDNTTFSINISYAWHVALVIWLFSFAQNFYVLMYMSPVYRKELRRQCACLPWCRAVQHERFETNNAEYRKDEQTDYV